MIPKTKDNVETDINKLIDTLVSQGYKVNSPEEIKKNEQIKTAMDENAELKDKLAKFEAQNNLKTAPVQDRVAMAIDHLAGMGVQVNTPMHSTRSGFGDEVTPSGEFVDEILEIMPKYETFLGMLPGKHEGVIGNNAGESHTVPIIGDVGLFTLGSEKAADTAFSNAKQTNNLPTDKVVLTSRQLVMRFDITDHLKKFGKIPDQRWESLLAEKVGAAYTRTIEAIIINGDTETGATGNVNSDDGAPAGTEYYLAADGLRKAAIGTTSPDADPSLGTLDTGDIFTLINVLGNMFEEDMCLWLTNTSTNNKLSSLGHFVKANERGDASTLATGVKLNKVAGVDVVRHRDFPLTEADGKVSTTASNNTKGGLLLFRKDCVQWGDSGQLYFKLYDFGAQGISLEFWTYVAVTIVNQKAGETGYSNVAYGINITV